ncbi:hypothetical protein BDY21DRAFT_354459 [Lineolata rhizophorae]|uniref:Uncharacterized protein n=1 Tax=Lineolata rhizophorae TaxID=578093 RepID=A0A6A6NR60_9PEZI|nr:hypothetical protein BDY21DRAFT_354459 [Lineolata rhizophorae]
MTATLNAPTHELRNGKHGSTASLSHRFTSVSCLCDSPNRNKLTSIARTRMDKTVNPHLLPLNATPHAPGSTTVRGAARTVLMNGATQTWLQRAWPVGREETPDRQFGRNVDVCAFEPLGRVCSFHLFGRPAIQMGGRGTSRKDVGRPFVGSTRYVCRHYCRPRLTRSWVELRSCVRTYVVRIPA